MIAGNRKKIVVIGGGTGSFVTLSGLRKYPVDLTAIVTVTDSGGSTGRLRTEFGFLPVGDLRQCLAALASEKQNLIKELLLCRFGKGKGLAGHNLGNLILTALTEMTGSEPKAIEAAAKIFRLRGQVLPISLTKTHLVAYYQDGSHLVGEHLIDEANKRGQRIVKLTTKHLAKIYSKASQSIKKSNLIILSAGDLFTSLLPNLIVKGTREAFKKTKAKIVYVLNLMNRYSQTHNFKASDYILEIKKYLGKFPDFVLVNTGRIPARILNLYKKEKGFPVLDDLSLKKWPFKVTRKDFLAKEIIVKHKTDQLARSYLRHDPKKLAKVLISLL